MKTNFALGLLSVLAVVAGVPLHAQGLPVEPGSCYRMEVGAWSGPVPSGWPEIHQVPPVVRLDSVLLPPPLGNRGFRRAAPDLTVLQDRTGGFAPYWRRVAADSLVIGWSSGHAGVTLRMERREGQISGVAMAFHDDVGPDIVQPTAPVQGHRTACPEALRLQPT